MEYLGSFRQVTKIHSSERFMHVEDEVEILAREIVTEIYNTTWDSISLACSLFSFFFFFG